MKYKKRKREKNLHNARKEALRQNKRTNTIKKQIVELNKSMKCTCTRNLLKRRTKKRSEVIM
jgi:hypothetical protein